MKQWNSVLFRRNNSWGIWTMDICKSYQTIDYLQPSVSGCHWQHTEHTVVSASSNNSLWHNRITFLVSAILLLPDDLALISLLNPEYKECVFRDEPAAQPTSRTHTHPDQASWAPFNLSKQPSCRRRTMWRWRMRSREMSRNQSIVWKSSYWPIPGGRSSRPSIKFVEPAIKTTLSIVLTNTKL